MAARARAAVAALRQEERGFTLIELLIATGLGLVVIGGAFTVFAGGVRSEPRTASKAAALEQARVTTDRITRELRQGREVTTASPTELAILTYVKQSTCAGGMSSTSIPCQVTYSCAGETCTRTVAQPDGAEAGAAVQVAEGLAGAEVFSYSPSATEPSYVGVSFSFANEGEPVVLEDGAALRNMAEEPVGAP
jgi:prepilin-type N-terminal cleavage/methylation domain-containing protein